MTKDALSRIVKSIVFETYDHRYSSLDEIDDDTELVLDDLDTRGDPEIINGVPCFLGLSMFTTSQLCSIVMFMELEEKLGIVIDDNDADACKTVGDAVELCFGILNK